VENPESIALRRGEDPAAAQARREAVLAANPDHRYQA
jgi:hypothetical protein